MVNMATKYNHLALVPRDEVISLFKTGVIYPASSIRFSGSLQSLTKKPKEVAKIFAKTPAIEYSINYFILYAETEKPSSLLTQGLQITSLVSIIPLDGEAARLGLSLSPPVRLEAPLFASDYLDYQEKMAVINAENGIKNMEQIFDVQDLAKSVSKFNVKKSIPAIVSIIMDETGNQKPKTIWEYLLTYSRAHAYPSDIKGAFLDVMSVVSNYKAQNTFSKNQLQTSTGQKMVELPTSKYAALMECMGAATKFIEEANKAYPDFWKIAPLYFVLLHYFQNTDNDGATISSQPVTVFVDHVKKGYAEEYLKPALLMLGITLGYTGSYKTLYAVHKDRLAFLER